jgi:hypothetical protein
VIAKQATGVTTEFAAALERALNGETRAEPTPPSTDGAEVPSPAPGGVRRSRHQIAAPTGGRDGPAASREPWHQDPRVTGLAGLSAGLVVALTIALRRR